jgi:beta-lactamase class D
MDNAFKSIINLLELQNEAVSQDLTIANKRIADLEQQVLDLSGPNDGSVEMSTETQTEFIQRIADSRTKFAKEAQDIIAAINGSVSA